MVPCGTAPAVHAESRVRVKKRRPRWPPYAECGGLFVRCTRSRRPRTVDRSGASSTMHATGGHAGRSAAAVSGMHHAFIRENSSPRRLSENVAIRAWMRCRDSVAWRGEDGVIRGRSAGIRMHESVRAGRCNGAPWNQAGEVRRNASTGNRERCRARFTDNDCGRGSGCRGGCRRSRRRPTRRSFSYARNNLIGVRIPLAAIAAGNPRPARAVDERP